MRIIHVSERILSLIALAITISLVSPSTAQPTANSETFQCKSLKSQTPADPSSKHTVALSWIASVSLSTPPAVGEGYNLYRLNPDGSCTKINGELIRGRVLEDRFVELGKTYRYAAKAVKQNSESGPSNVVEVTIPLT